jgi:putative nucleotidyltransferase-like protein
MGDPVEPELDPLAVACRVAAGLLPGEEPPALLTLSEERWIPVLGKLDWERLTGLAVAQTEADSLHLPQQQAAVLLERHRSAMVWALAVERTLLNLADAFEGHGIDFVVLKGPSVAHTVYPDPSWRPFGDLDLLVRTGDWRRACSILADLGFRRRVPEPRPGFDERFGKAATHVGEGGVEVDLHRTLVLGPFGLWMAPEELFEHTASFQVGGRTFLRLDDTALLLHVCMHASLGFRIPLLLPLRDVAQVARAGAVDWGILADLAAGWRLEAVVQHAFRAVEEYLRVPWPAEAEPIMGRRPARAERRALLAYTTERRQRGGTALSTLRAIPGFRARVAFVRSMLFPDRRFLSARAGENGSPTYRRRWAKPVRWLRADRTGGRR